MNLTMNDQAANCAIEMTAPIDHEGAMTTPPEDGFRQSGTSPPLPGTGSKKQKWAIHYAMKRTGL